DSPRCGKVPFEGRRTLQEGLAIGEVTRDELLETYCLEATVGFGDRARLDEPQGRHRRRIVESLELVVAEVAGSPEGDDRPVPFAADEDRLGDGSAARDGEGPELADRARLSGQARQGLDHGFVDGGGMGEHAPMSVDDRD